jgi:hypothetical protein
MEAEHFDVIVETHEIMAEAEGRDHIPLAEGKEKGRQNGPAHQEYHPDEEGRQKNEGADGFFSLAGCHFRLFPSSMNYLVCGGICSS